MLHSLDVFHLPGGRLKKITPVVKSGQGVAQRPLAVHLLAGPQGGLHFLFFLDLVLQFLSHSGQLALFELNHLLFGGQNLGHAVKGIRQRPHEFHPLAQITVGHGVALPGQVADIALKGLDVAGGTAGLSKFVAKLAFGKMK